MEYKSNTKNVSINPPAICGRIYRAFRSQKAGQLSRYQRILTLAVGLAVALASAWADGATYYINNLPNAGGSNENPGTSEQKPWLDFTPVNGLKLKPGDRILLARGAMWNQQLTINDSGTAQDWCELGAYGAGPRPKIIRNGSALDRCVRLNNPSYWKIANLEVGRAGCGILIYYDTPGHEGLVLEDIFAHHCFGIFTRDMKDGPAKKQAQRDRISRSSGILITSILFNPAVCVLRNVLLDRIEGTGNGDSVAITTGSFNSSGFVTFQNVVMNHLYLHDDNGPNPGGIPDGLIFSGVMNAVLMNSILDRECGQRTRTGTAAIFLAQSQGLTFVNNMLMRTQDTGSPDQCAIDFEQNEKEVKIRNNYFGLNAGPGVEFLDIGSTYSEGHEVSGNTFEGNGWAAHGGQTGSGGLHGSGKAEGVIRDNLIYEPGKPLFHGKVGRLRLKNNLALKQNVYNSMNGFSGTQGKNGWFYQYRLENGRWSNAESYDTERQAWVMGKGDSKAWIGRFEQRGGTDASEVARAWKAPFRGRVTVRGRALKSYKDGGEATVQMTRNGELIWGPKAVPVKGWGGIEINIDDLHVYRGDWLRFETRGVGTNVHDAVSWAPAVAYIENAEYAGVWGFNTDGNAERWRVEGQAALTVTGGVACLEARTDDAALVSPGDLDLDATRVRYIHLRMRNRTSGARATVYFTTSVERNRDETKRLEFAVSAEDEDVRYYVVDMAANPKWQGLIKDLRICPAVAVGKVEVATIMIGGTPFKHPDGLSANPVVDVVTGEAPLRVRVDGRASRAEGAAILTYRWDFGDGAVAEGPAVEYTYRKPGSHAATLTVTDDKGRTDRDRVVIEVKPEDKTPPELLSVGVTSLGVLVVKFNEPVEQSGAETAANYALDRGVRVLSAVHSQQNPAEVVLRVSSLTKGASYTLTARNMKDRARMPQVQMAGTSVTFEAVPGLAGHWLLNDREGDTVADSSSSGLHGTIAGKITRSGERGGALVFDGAGSAVGIKAGAFPALADTFTMALWAKPTAQRTATPETTSGISGGGGVQRFAVSPDHGRVAYRDADHAGVGLSIGTNGVSVFEHSDNHLPSLLVCESALSDWTHVVVVFEKRRPTLYLNGALAKTGERSNMTVHPSASLGGSTHGWYAGMLTDVRIYSRALSAEEIEALAGEARAR